MTSAGLCSKVFALLSCERRCAVACVVTIGAFEVVFTDCAGEAAPASKDCSALHVRWILSGIEEERESVRWREERGSGEKRDVRQDWAARLSQGSGEARSIVVIRSIVRGPCKVDKVR